MKYQGEPTLPKERGEAEDVTREELEDRDESTWEHQELVRSQQTHEAERRIERDVLREEVQRFTLARRESGIVTADAAWVDRPCDNWLAALHGQEELTLSSMARLAVGMSLSLPMRDALIVSIVAREDSGDVPVTKQLMVSFASRPHEPHNVACMSDLLSHAFEHRHAHTDEAKCKRGIEMLGQMVRALPEEYTVQPLAVLAYAAWWIADDRAGEYALSALRLDENCTLAGIVCAALGQGL